MERWHIKANLRFIRSETQRSGNIRVWSLGAAPFVFLSALARGPKKSGAVCFMERWHIKANLRFIRDEG
jgi:hypothetical protein